MNNYENIPISNISFPQILKIKETNAESYKIRSKIQMGPLRNMYVFRIFILK